MVVQWLRLCTPNAGGPSLIPGLRTCPCMPKLSVYMLQLKIPQPNNKIKNNIKYFLKKKLQKKR